MLAVHSQHIYQRALSMVRASAHRGSVADANSNTYCCTNARANCDPDNRAYGTPNAAAHGGAHGSTLGFTNARADREADCCAVD